jgi:hypothetical protein
MLQAMFNTISIQHTMRESEAIEHGIGILVVE